MPQKPPVTAVYGGLFGLGNGLADRHRAEQEGGQLTLVDSLGAGRLFVMLALAAFFVMPLLVFRLMFLRAMPGLLALLRLLHLRGFGRAGLAHFRRFHAGDMIVELAAGRAAVVLLA